MSEALKARLASRVRAYSKDALDPEDRPFDGDPPQDVHFSCGSCLRRGVLRRADLFSYTPLPRHNRLRSGGPPPESFPTEVLEGRCLECALYFRGRLLEYDFGRRVLWAQFCRETSRRVMDS